MTDGTDVFTTLHFALMGLLAALVVVAIVVGIARKRRRVTATREVEEHAAEAGVEVVPPAPKPGQPVAAPAPLAPQAAAIADPSPVTPPVFAPPERAPPLAAEPVATADTLSPAEGPVTQIKGLGPKVATRLGELGIDRVGQLASLDGAQAAELDAAMGAFQGRMARDRWIEQARLLAAGDRDGFERVFGKL